MSKKVMGALSVLVLCGAFAAIAMASVTSQTVTSTATVNKAGSKKKPAPFAGKFLYTATTDDGGRTATPVSWAFKWDGVKINGAKFPKCTAEEIDLAQSDAGCPPGSLITESPAVANSGPESDPMQFFECKGKTIRFYNAGPQEWTFYVVGPGDQCAGLTYLAPVSMPLTTKKGTTTVKVIFPQNLTHPLPGIESGVALLDASFKKRSVGSGKKKTYLMSSSKCKGQRKFTFTVVDEDGTHPLTANAGKCK